MAYENTNKVSYNDTYHTSYDKNMNKQSKNLVDSKWINCLNTNELNAVFPTQTSSLPQSMVNPADGPMETPCPPMQMENYSNAALMPWCNNRSQCSKPPVISATFRNHDMGLSRKIDNHHPIENEGWITSPIVQRKSSKDTTYINYGNATYFQSLF